ncbi:hypothetical protein [Nonomuraea basaltis]|uniref:hypothetical protein n=1 Tax=Nonomuraea basaltis TaxID=2495887 RepID=UPI00110C41EE|nr:hypothetical protein [Nonomuraea basaltis]TMR91579.1 hypothetical protein EJK15_49110 [Nonomuraea basaltis]
MTSSQDPPQGDDPDARDDHWTQPSPLPRPPYRQQASDQVLSIVGLACAVVAVLFSPVLFGLAGIVLGIAGHTRDQPLGKWAAVSAGVGMIIGTVLSAVVEAMVS